SNGLKVGGAAFRTTIPSLPRGGGSAAAAGAASGGGGGGGGGGREGEREGGREGGGGDGRGGFGGGVGGRHARGGARRPGPVRRGAAGVPAAGGAAARLACARRQVPGGGEGRGGETRRGEGKGGGGRTTRLRQPPSPSPHPAQTRRESQVELREQIDNLATELCRINEDQKVALDLDPYVKKLLNARRRVVLVNNILQNAQLSQGSPSPVAGHPQRPRLAGRTDGLTGWQNLQDDHQRQDGGLEDEAGRGCDSSRAGPPSRLPPPRCPRVDAHLLGRVGGEILVAFEQRLAERRLVLSRLHPWEGHLALERARAAARSPESVPCLWPGPRPHFLPHRPRSAPRTPAGKETHHIEIKRDVGHEGAEPRARGKEEGGHRLSRIRVRGFLST
uniref:Biogenesis of lysosome-related organelles complex 1 subunit 7 n=1 Tax=Ornithorhynchus anatinus TaxID=9258 RepID=A0A6I8PPX5_ORNAN